MADDVLNLIVTARDNASATLARTSKEVRGLGPAAATTAGPMARLSAVTGGLVSPTTLAIGAVTGLTVGALKLADSAREDQTSLALLNTALQENAKDYDANSTKVEDAISARQKLGFTDEEQRASLGALVAITKDSSAALDVQRTAMDLARLKGLDLNTATTLLGKVYGGNIGILARYGIQLEKGATSTEALAEIQKRAAGQAEAWAETSEGAAVTAGIAFDEAGERIGYAILPVLTEISKAVRDDLVPALEDGIDALGKIGEASDEVDAFFGKLHDDILRDTDIEIDPGDWARAIHNFVDDGVRDLFNLGSSLNNAEENFGSFSEGAAEAWRAAGEATTVGGQIIIEGAKRTADGAAKKIGEIPQKSADALLENQFHLNPAVNELRQFMEDAIPPRKEKLRLKAFLASEAVADGLESGKPLVVRKTKEMVEAAEARLDQLDGRSAGEKLAQTYAEGIDGAAWNAEQAAARMAAGVAGFLEFSGSPPYTKSRKIGAEVARTYGEALNEGLADIVVPQLPMLDGRSTARVGAGAAGLIAGGGGVVININSTFPPTRSQAAEIARELLPSMERERTRQKGPH